MIKRIISLTVLNQPGVLNRITNLFSKRNYNIESISVGHSELEGVSRITCVYWSITKILSNKSQSN